MKLDRPLVSFLLPIAPVSPWLAQTLMSLKNQTYSNWELIAVLDGQSTENVKIISDADLENPVQILTHDVALGIATSLNDGLKVAQGELIARIDADDINLPTRLEQQVKSFLANPNLVLLGGSALVIDRYGLEAQAPRIVPTGVSVVSLRLLRRNALIHPTVMFRKEVVQRAGGYNPKCIRTEDYELWLRLASFGEVDNLPEPILKYRVHPNQHTSGSAIISISEAAQIWQSRKMLGAKLNQSKVKLLLNQIIWLGNRYLRK